MCNQMELMSGIFLPEHNHCPLTRIKCGKEKLNWATGQTLTPIGLENRFSRGAPKQWTHRWLQRCQNCLRGCPGEPYSTGSAYSAKNDVVGLPSAGKNPLQLPMDSREGSIVSVSPMTRICQWRTGHLQSSCRLTAHSRACHSGQMQGSEASTLHVCHWVSSRVGGPLSDRNVAAPRRLLPPLRHSKHFPLGTAVRTTVERRAQSIQNRSSTLACQPVHRIQAHFRPSSLSFDVSHCLPTRKSKGLHQRIQLF